MVDAVTRTFNTDRPCINLIEQRLTTPTRLTTPMRLSTDVLYSTLVIA